VVEPTEAVLQLGDKDKFRETYIQCRVDISCSFLRFL
jgi:hypothetical protein